MNKYMAPIPLKGNHSNSEVNEICHRYSVKKTDPITKKFRTTLPSKNVQNFFVIG